MILKDCLLPAPVVNRIQVMPPGGIIQFPHDGFRCLPSQLLDPLFHITQGVLLFEGGTGYLQSAGKPFNLRVFCLRFFLLLAPALDPVEQRFRWIIP